jgi:uncharacterized protein YihD (DUF1040 family)
MRDPNRIDRICELLKKEWHKYPDLRLMQLLINAAKTRDEPKLFHMEDEEIEEKLKNEMF